MSDSKQYGPGTGSLSLAERLSLVESENVTFLSPDFPIFWNSAKGVWVKDADHNEYIDMTSAFGVAALGHGHGSIRDALHQQVDVLIHGMGDVHPSSNKVELLEKLAKSCPIENPRITLGTSGTMATEIALKAARLYTGKAKVLNFEGGYHGLTAGALRVIGHSKFNEPFKDILGPQVQQAEFPDDRDPASLKRSLDQVETALKTESLAAVIVEPIQGRGGIRIPPKDFLPKLSALCRAHDALLILDEIFTGFYRTGPRFACMDSGVVPDLLLVGKALGGGLPIGACIASKAIMDAFGPSPGEATHTETFLGHPLTMASAAAVLDYFNQFEIDRKVEDASKKLESTLKECTSGLGSSIIEIRGRGLMWGIEVESSELCKSIVGSSLKQGIIILGGGMKSNVVQFTPPLTISGEEIAIFGKRFTQALQALDEWEKT